MELFAAILTGTLASALFLYLHAGRLARGRQAAGKLLCSGAARFMTKRFGVRHCLLVFFGVLLIGTPTSPTDAFLRITVMCCLGIVLWTANRGPEFRDEGILLPSRGLSLLHWDQIWYCQWLADPGTLRVVIADDFETLHVAPEQVFRATDVLLGRVRLFDARNSAMNPEFDPPAGARPEKREDTRVPFQFDLRTLLFFMVVASSAFAWLGIHLRAQWREEAALEALSRFRPSVTTSDDRVSGLDFSGSKPGPADADVTQLEAFTELRFLNLSNTPITDAALVDLERLRKLRFLSLVGTRVTDEGVGRLKESLPDTTIRH